MKIKFKGMILADVLKDKEYKDKVLNVYNQLTQPSAEYLENGFRFTDEYISEIRTSLILSPFEYIAFFVSEKGKKRLDERTDESKEAVKSFLKNKDLFYYFQQMNVEILGFLAYAANQDNQDEDVEYCAIKVLNMYYDWVKMCMDNDRDGIVKMVDEHHEWLISLN